MLSFAVWFLKVIKLYIIMAGKKFRCIKCPFESNYSSQFNMHIEGVHDKTKSYVCDECSSAFTQKGNLKMHKESVHEKIKPHVCGECLGLSSQRKGI